MGGAIFSTNNGEPIKDIPPGDVMLDFRHGTVTDSAGTLTLMNTNLDYYNLTQANSIAIFASDAETEINIGNSLTLKDHQITHQIDNYAFDYVRVNIPSLSTPSDSNQLMFVASTDQILNYNFKNYAHFRSNVTATTANAYATIVQHHVGGYDQFIYYIHNSHGSNAMTAQVDVSNDGTNFFTLSGYVGGVNIAAGDTNLFVSDQQHHFFRVRLKSTVGGAHATAKVYWNYVENL
tara:strand:- start:1939 stop:2643 length:705 start_codon:yes stop_codon:yes gene_type:complete